MAEAEYVESLAGRLRVTPGIKDQVRRGPEELLMVVNAVEWGIREFDKARSGQDSFVAPAPEIESFLEDTYAITRFAVGEEPTHPMLASLLEVYRAVRVNQEPVSLQSEMWREYHDRRP